MMYFRAEIVQPKWLRTRSAEIQHEKYFDCWFYHVGRWIVNETTWKTDPKLLKSVFENQTAETEFWAFKFWVSWVFRKLIHYKLGGVEKSSGGQTPNHPQFPKCTQDNIMIMYLSLLQKIKQKIQEMEKIKKKWKDGIWNVKQILLHTVWIKLKAGPSFRVLSC